MASRHVLDLRIPDSKLARELTEFVRDTESELLFNHSLRVYCWASLAGRSAALQFDPDLLYAGCMFHDMGLTSRYQHSQLRFEVDGANSAREFLQARGIDESAVETVWNAVALHTTPGIPQFMRSEIALLQAGAGMDVAGRGFELFTEAQRAAVVAAFPRGDNFELGIIDAFYQGMKHRPASTFGTFNDDFLAFKDPAFQRVDLCRVILGSDWTRGCALGATCSAHAHLGGMHMTSDREPGQP